MCWPLWNRRPGFRNENSLRGFHASFRQQLTSTRQMAVYRGHSSKITIIHCKRADCQMGIIWTIIIGFIVGVVAKFLMPGDNEPSGFILTTVLGIVGAFVATFL